MVRFKSDGNIIFNQNPIPFSDGATLTMPVISTTSPGITLSTSSLVTSHSIVLGTRPESILSSGSFSCKLISKCASAG